MKILIEKILLTILIILFSGIYVCAQNDKLSSKNKKAIKAFYSGVQSFDFRKYTQAEEQFNMAILLDPGFLEARQMLAAMYEEQNLVYKAIEHYEKIQQINPVFFPNNYFFIGNLALKEGMYEKALQNYLLFVENPDIHPDLMKTADEKIVQTEFAVQLKNNPVPFNPVNLGPAINTPDIEFFPTLTADEQTLFFTKNRPRDQYTICTYCKYEEDFYVSYKVNGKWSVAVPLGHPINTHGNEGAGTISPDGMMFIYTACERDDGFGSCDLYISQRAGNKWSYPENMGPVVNSNKWDSQPSIAPDGKTLYFVSAREGNRDIFVTSTDEHGVWQKPVNLGPPVNTEKDENSPFIHPDGKTLYFMSDGHPGMGGMDIFMSQKQHDGTWSIPVNIGYPINTHKDEGFFIVSASGKTAYFASDQLGGYGKFDLYSFELPEQVRPVPVYYLKGLITDKSTDKPLRAEFELYDLETGNLVVKSFSDEQDGSFLVCLPSNTGYALNVSKKGFLFWSEYFNFSQTSHENKPIEKNIELQPVRIGEIVVMNNIFFDFDSDKLKQESVVELKILLQLLSSHPDMNIEIRGHTDNVGTAQYNKILSEKRALSVYNYLIINGINKSRLTYKGFGDTIPVAPNDSDEGRALNRRTEFKVTKM